MNSTMYPDETATTSETSPTEPTKPAAKEEGETFLVPKSIIGDKEPGAKVMFEIVKGYDDEYEVKFSDSENTKDNSTEPMTANQEIDMVAAKGGK